MNSSVCRSSATSVVGCVLGIFLMAAAPRSTPASVVPGALWWEVFTNVPGTSIAGLTNASKFPGQPDIAGTIDSFETPRDWANAYGERLSGVVLPPVTGNYVFYIAADDQAELYLSSDLEPGHKVRIAWEDNWSFPRAWSGLSGGRTNSANVSAPIYLEAGKAYYVEALHKEGGGGDHFGVAWQEPGNPPPENMSPPIGGEYLGRIEPSPVITQSPFSQTRFVNQVASFGVTAQGPSPLVYQWLRNETPIPGATATNFSLQATQAAMFSVAVSDASGSITSAPARLTVLPRPIGPGSLDVTFDPTWMNQLSGLAQGHGTVYCMARQRDGKVIVGGSFTVVNNRPRNSIARLNPDGTIDESFNPGYGVDGPVQRVAVLPGGKVLICGYFSSVNGSPRDGIARLYGDGAVDPGFRPAIQGSQPVGLCVQHDGKILIGGPFTNVCGTARRGLARLNADGTLDTNFDASTVVSSDGASVSAIAVREDGRILIGGHFTPGTYDRPLACLMPDGSVDPDLLVPTIRENSIGWVNSVTLDADGKILIGGRFWSVNDSARPGVARLLPNGVLDASFIPPILDQKIVERLTSVGDKILIGGAFTSVDGVIRRGLARLNADGSFDPAFDPGSAISVDAPPWINDLLADTNSILVAAGLPDNYAASSPHPLLQLSQDGSVDPQYRTPQIANQAPVRVMAVQPDGKTLVLLSDQASVDGVTRGPLVRLLPDGTRDPSFARVLQGGSASCLALQSDGKILLGGEHFILTNGTLVRGLMRLNAKGTSDPAFSTEGGDQLLWVSNLALQPDGRIVVIGEFDKIRGGERSFMARLNADGTLDESFTLDPSLVVVAGEYDPPLNFVAVQPDGRILLGGWFNDVEARLVRLMPDGSLDRELVSPATATSVDCIAQQPDGRLIVGGRFQVGEPGLGSTVIRITSEGDLDTVFDSAFNHITGLALQSDGKVLVGVGAESEALVRYLPNGTRDPSFMPNLRSGPGSAYLQSILLQPDEQVLISGALTTVDGIPWNGIARLNNVIDRPTSWVTRQLPGQHAPAGPTVQLVAQPPASVTVYAVQEQAPTNWAVTHISDGGIFDRTTGKVKFGPYFDNTARTLKYDVFPPPGFEGVGKFAGTASADGVSTAIIGDSTCVIGGPHPADIAERDWRLGIDEVTAYGAAWRTGGVWACGPNPIPMSYVTRAAALWRGGETYAIDPVIAGPPLWWVNTASLGSIESRAKAMVVDGTATRQLPAGFLAGEPVEVAIAVQLATGTAAYALEESVPPDALLVGVLDGGTCDGTAGKVKWGPFLDSAARVLRYQVTLNRPEGGTLHFAGAASFDGHLAVTGGNNQIRSTSKLTWSKRPDDREWGLQLRGDSGAVYELQSSSDLVQWETVGRVTNTTGTVEIPLTIKPGSPHLFYRATLVGD